MDSIGFINQIKEALLRRRKVQELTGLSRSGLYIAMKNGSFPPPVRIGVRAVAWRSGDVMKWISERVSS